MQDLGRIVIAVGAVIIAVGVVLYMGLGHVLFGWMGRLPGDIRVEKENSRFYFPIATSIVLSIILTLIFQLVIRIRGGH